MAYLAIDPGNVQSAWVIYEPRTRELLHHGLEPNAILLNRIVNQGWSRSDLELKTPVLMAMELIQSMGMAVGQTVFNTCIWTGRFVQAWLQDHDERAVQYVSRREEKLHLCGSMRAKDGNIRQAIMDRYGSTRQLALGTKANPGPLYGMAKDKWAAMAVAITAYEGEPSDHTV
mgnify:CR=1 FL=1|jgi:hypothetical protein